MFALVATCLNRVRLVRGKYPDVLGIRSLTYDRDEDREKERVCDK